MNNSLKVELIVLVLIRVALTKTDYSVKVIGKIAFMGDALHKIHIKIYPS